VCYRWWAAAVEQITDEWIVTVSPAETRVEGLGGGWTLNVDARAFYWFTRPYALVEFYQPDDALGEVYIHIASPACVEGTCVRYTDHELDVVKRPGEPPRLIDEEEFAEAAIAYGYTPEFQAACREAAAEATRVATGWAAWGCPPGGPQRP
jgi:protein associated with RNAse G/E